MISNRNIDFRQCRLAVVVSRLITFYISPTDTRRKQKCFLRSRPRIADISLNVQTGSRVSSGRPNPVTVYSARRRLVMNFFSQTLVISLRVTDERRGVARRGKNHPPPVPRTTPFDPLCVFYPIRIAVSYQYVIMYYVNIGRVRYFTNASLPSSPPPRRHRLLSDQWSSTIEI